MIGIVLGEFFISDFRDEAAGSSDSDVDCHFRARASLPRLPEAVMADSSESNPTYLIIGIIVTLVLIFFVGNIWAYTEATKRFPKKPTKRMGAKARKREVMKKGVSQAGE